MEESKRLELLRAMPLLLEEQAKSRRIWRWKLDLNSIAVGSYEEQLAQAGIVLPKEVYFGIVCFAMLIFGYLGALLGKLLALFAAALVGYYLLRCLPDERAQKRRRKIVPQLPS